MSETVRGFDECYLADGVVGCSGLGQRGNRLPSPLHSGSVNRDLFGTGEGLRRSIPRLTPLLNGRQGG